MALVVDGDRFARAQGGRAEHLRIRLQRKPVRLAVGHQLEAEHPQIGVVSGEPHPLGGVRELAVPLDRCLPGARGPGLQLQGAVRHAADHLRPGFRETGAGPFAPHVEHPLAGAFRLRQFLVVLGDHVVRLGAARRGAVGRGHRDQIPLRSSRRADLAAVLAAVDVAAGRLGVGSTGGRSLATARLRLVDGRVLHRRTIPRDIVPAAGGKECGGGQRPARNGRFDGLLRGEFHFSAPLAFLGEALSGRRRKRNGVAAKSTCGAEVPEGSDRRVREGTTSARRATSPAWNAGRRGDREAGYGMTRLRRLFGYGPSPWMFSSLLTSKL